MKAAGIVLMKEKKYINNSKQQINLLHILQFLIPVLLVCVKSYKSAPLMTISQLPARPP